MSQMMDLVLRLQAQAQEEGLELTDEQLIEAARSMYRPAESRTDGAPAEPMSIDDDLTPAGYMGALAERSAQLAAGGLSNPLPMDPGYTTDGDILAYREGMSAEDYDAAKANQRYRTSMIRGMGQDGGIEAQVHSQQPLNLGTAEQMEDWNDFLAGNRQAMERYDPEGYAAMRQGEQDRFNASHAAKLQTRGYVGDAAGNYLASQAGLAPVDYAASRTTAEDKRVRDRFGSTGDELLARHGDAGARTRLQSQDAASGYRGAMSNQNPIAGTRQTMGQRFADNTKARRQDEDLRRQAVRNRNMLAGPDAAQNLTNAFTMMGQPAAYGMNQDQADALGYMMPGADLRAEVESRNLAQATGLAGSAMRDLLAQITASGMLGQQNQAPQGTPAPPTYDELQTALQRGEYRGDAVRRYVEDKVTQLYSNWSSFSEEEAEELIPILVEDGIPEIDARSVVADIYRQRRARQSSSWVPTAIFDWFE